MIFLLEKIEQLEDCQEKLDQAYNEMKELKERVEESKGTSSEAGSPADKRIQNQLDQMSQMMSMMKEHQVRMSVVQQQNPFSTVNSTSQDNFSACSMNNSEQETKQKVAELESRNIDLLQTNSEMSKQVVSLQKKIE